MHKDLLVVNLLGGEAELALFVTEATDRGDFGSRSRNRCGDGRRGSRRHERWGVRVDSGGLLRLNGSRNRLPLLDGLAREDGWLGGGDRCLLLDTAHLLVDLSNHSRASVTDIVNELASHSIGAITVRAELFAQLGLVESGDIGLNHHVSSSMGEGALKN